MHDRKKPPHVCHPPKVGRMDGFRLGEERAGSFIASQLAAMGGSLHDLLPPGDDFDSDTPLGRFLEYVAGKGRCPAVQEAIASQLWNLEVHICRCCGRALDGHPLAVQYFATFAACSFA